MSQLDFSIVSNNTDTPTIYVYDRDDLPVDVSDLAVKWQLFDQNNVARITKTTGAGQIAKVADPDTLANPTGVINGLSIAILPADTVPLPQGYYPHEAVTVTGSSQVVTITDNDQILSYGTAFIRKQLTVQP